MARGVDIVGSKGSARKDAGPGPFTRGGFSFKDTATFLWTVTDDQAGNEIEIEATAMGAGPPGPPGPPGPGSPGPTGPSGGSGPTGPPGTGSTAYAFVKTGDLLSEPQRNSLSAFPSGFSVIRDIAPAFYKILTAGQNADYFQITGVGGIGGTTITVNWNTIVPIGGASDQIVHIGAAAAGD